MMGKFIDLTARRFGRLVVLERAVDYITPKGVHRVRWRCCCDCGNECVVTANCLIRNETKSCGCLHAERSSENIKRYMENRTTDPCVTHGRTVKGNIERLYKVWTSMRARCNNPNHKSYKRYGGRGIAICEEWNDYEKFRKWAMTNGYDADAPFGQCTIDRIDVNGNYCPENCRWVNAKEQASNLRKNRKILYEGSTYTAKQFAEKFMLPYATVISRLNRGYYKEVK